MSPADQVDWAAPAVWLSKTSGAVACTSGGSHILLAAQGGVGTGWVSFRNSHDGIDKFSRATQITQKHQGPGDRRQSGTPAKQGLPSASIDKKSSKLESCWWFRKSWKDGILETDVRRFREYRWRWHGHPVGRLGQGTSTALHTLYHPPLSAMVDRDRRLTVHPK